MLLTFQDHAWLAGKIEIVTFLISIGNITL